MAPAPEICFGTDGWRAVIGREFTFDNVRRIADAAGRVFASDSPGGVVLVGYDTRFQANAFAATTAEVLASHSLDVRLSDRMLPTPALSFAADRGPAIGAVMLTASHNPSEYLGFKLKMADGGSAPPSFTERQDGRRWICTALVHRTRRRGASGRRPRGECGVRHSRSRDRLHSRPQGARRR